MSNRLKLFRERMAAFEGAANPSEAIESGYYVHAPGKLLVDTISGRIALRPSSSHLLLGGIGSGKTTQLLVACQQINEIEDTHAIYVDVSLYTDISQITSGVLTAIAGLEIAKLIQDSKDKNIIQSVESIRDLANGYASYNYDEYPEPHEYDEPIIVKGIIPKKSEGYGISLELVKTVSELIKYTSEKYGNLVLLFDGLDRLDDAKMFMQLVFSDAKAISSAGIGLVLVGSLTAIYGNYHDTINKSLDYFYYQPFFDVENDPEAYNFFEQIIKTRSSEHFIEESAMKALINFSGGVLRDLIILTQASIEETYLSGEDKVQEQQVLKAVDSTGRNQLLGISDNELKIIKQILQTGTFIPRTDEDLRLLVRRIILEYRYPKLRYAVHPAMKPLIQQILD
jgi:Cdc6-like AAA superfamily ATPase